MSGDAGAPAPTLPLRSRDGLGRLQLCAFHPLFPQPARAC